MVSEDSLECDNQEDPLDKLPYIYKDPSHYTTIIIEWVLPLIPFPDVELMGHKKIGH